MKQTRKAPVVLALILSISMALSACGLFNAGEKINKEDDIDEVVSDFFDSLTDGSYAADDYESDLTTDDSFSKFEFTYPEAEELMILSLEKSDFEIDEIDVDDDEATCDMTVTTVDLGEILVKLGDEYDFIDIQYEIEDRGAPTEDFEVSLELEYDDEEWLITDLSDLADVLGKPYKTLDVIKIIEVPEPTEPEYKTFSMFIAMPGTELNEDNVVREKIAEITGVKLEETYLTGQTSEEAIGVMVASGDYPDFIEPSDGYRIMADAGALIPIDEYWDHYPNIRNYLSDEEWNMLRQEDGHIYSIPQFGVVNDHDTEPLHNAPAFWIQTRVLKWAGYPEITTLDEYFQLLEDYAAANPTHVDGTAVIPYTILCEGWRNYSLYAPPSLLAGYHYEGSTVAVNPLTNLVVDCSMSDVAKKIYQKLNDEYKKGIIDPDSFTQTLDEYTAKISTGRVLGFYDEYWNWGYTAGYAIEMADLEGCTYVPLGLVAEAGIEEHYHNEPFLDLSGGLSITVSCEDIEGAMQFIDDSLSQEVMTLRFWGIEGVDYLVDENGLFYRTPEMRINGSDALYKVDNLCRYEYFPHYEGMNLDGINAWSPSNQPSEFFENQRPEVQECFLAYNARTYTEMLNPSQPNEPWYPMWTYSNEYTTDTPAGEAKNNIFTVQQEYLPSLITEADFEAAWTAYVDAYNSRCDVATFLADMQAEVDRRIAIANMQ